MTTHPLRSFRQSSGLTLDALGDLVGVTKGVLSKIENGKMKPSLGLAVKIEKVTNGVVTPNDFVKPNRSRK